MSENLGGDFAGAKSKPAAFWKTKTAAPAETDLAAKVAGNSMV
jgi:hypothetical protein